MADYILPTFKKSFFNCPHCGANSEQFWSDTFFESTTFKQIIDLNYCRCKNCTEYTIWQNGKLIYPFKSYIPTNNNLPTEIKKIFDEARAILNYSPRSSAALLRLCLEKICKVALEIPPDAKWTGLARKIENLKVKYKFNEAISTSLDLIRDFGNGSVHGDTYGLETDDIEIAKKLFELINVVVENVITHPTINSDLKNFIEERKNKI